MVFFVCNPVHSSPFEVLALREPPSAFRPLAHTRRWSGRRRPTMMTGFEDPLLNMLSVDLFDDDEDLLTPRKVRLLDPCGSRLMLATNDKPTKGGLALEVGDGFSPEEVRYKVDPETRTVSLRAEHKGDNGCQRMVTRVVTAPKDCDLSKIKLVRDEKTNRLVLKAPPTEAALEDKSSKMEGVTHQKDSPAKHKKPKSPAKEAKEEVEKMETEQQQQKPQEQPQPAEQTQVDETTDTASVSSEDSNHVDTTTKVGDTHSSTVAANTNPGFKASVNLEGFSPSDARVEVQDDRGLVKVVALREEVEPESGAVEKRFLEKSFVLDSSRVDPATLKASFQGSVLTLTAEPRVVKKNDVVSRDIPVVTL